MTIRAALFGVGLSFLLNVVGGAQVQDLPGATDDHGGFGLPDQRGSRLLVILKLARPEVLKAALCSGGRRVPVKFERRQVEGANSDGRQTGRSFDELAGSVFTVLGSTIDPDAPCFLASEALLAGSAVLSITALEGPGACLQPGRFATLRARPVVPLLASRATGPRETGRAPRVRAPWEGCACEPRLRRRIPNDVRRCSRGVSGTGRGSLEG